MLLAITPSTISKFSVKKEVKVLRASDSADFALAFAMMFVNAGMSIAADAYYRDNDNQPTIVNAFLLVCLFHFDIP